MSTPSASPAETPAEAPADASGDSSSQRHSPALPARGTLQLFVARGVYMVIGYVVAVILARGLGPAKYGVYSVLLSILVWLELAGGFGLSGAASKMIPQAASAKDDPTPVEQATSLLLLLVSVLLYGACWLAAPLVADILAIENGATLFRLATPDLPLNGLYLAYQGILGGHRRFGTLSVALIVYAFTKLGGIVLLLLGGLSVAGALVVNVLATAGVLAFLLVKAPPKLGLPPKPVLRAVTLLALPIGLYIATSQVLLNLDFWFLKALWTGSDDNIGHYGAAINLAKLLTMIPSVLSGVLFASLSRALASNDEALGQHHVRSALRFVLVILGAASLLAWHAKDVMTFLYSSEYAPGGVFLALQLAGFALWAILAVFCNSMMAAGRHYLTAGILIGLIPVAIGLDVVLIPEYGGLGAAASLASAQALGCLIMGALTWRRFGAFLDLGRIARIGGAAVLTLAGSRFVPLDGNWILTKLLLLLSVYVLLLIAFREIKREELAIKLF